MMNRRQAKAACAVLSGINLKYADKDIKLDIVRNVTRLKPIVTATDESAKEIQSRLFTEELSARIAAHNARINAKDVDYINGEAKEVKEEAERVNREVTTLMDELYSEDVAVDMIPLDADKLLDAMDKSGVDYNAEDMADLECLFGKID